MILYGITELQGQTFAAHVAVPHDIFAPSRIQAKRDATCEESLMYAQPQTAHVDFMQHATSHIFCRPFVLLDAPA